MFGEKRLAIFAIVSAGLMATLCVSAIATAGFHHADFQAALPGSIAPEIATRDLENQDLTLSSLRGNFVLVYFTPASIDLAASSASQQTSSKNIAALHQLGAALNARQVTVLENESPASEEPMKLFSVATGDGESISTSPVSHDQVGTQVGAINRTLIDIDGVIARRFRVDAVAEHSTLFVIDANGVIRYRGSFEQGAVPELVHQFAATNNAQKTSNLPAAYVDNHTRSDMAGPLASLIRF